MEEQQKPKGLFASLMPTNINPWSIGLLNAAGQMLQASGPSLKPTNWATALGAGLSGLSEGYLGANKSMAESDYYRQRGQFMPYDRDVRMAAANEFMRQWKIENPTSDLNSQEWQDKFFADAQEAGVAGDVMFLYNTWAQQRRLPAGTFPTGTGTADQVRTGSGEPITEAEAAARKAGEEKATNIKFEYGGNTYWGTPDQARQVQSSVPPHGLPDANLNNIDFFSRTYGDLPPIGKMSAAEYFRQVQKRETGGQRNPWTAQNAGGDYGFVQFSPDTWKLLMGDAPKTPENQIEASRRNYLRIVQSSKGDPLLAISQWNTGPGSSSIRKSYVGDMQPTPSEAVPIGPSTAQQKQIESDLAVEQHRQESAIDDQSAGNKELAKGNAEKQLNAPNRLRIIANRLADIDQAIKALKPVTDPISKKVTGFGFETGGFLGGSGITPSYYYEMINDPSWRALQRVGVGEELNRAMEDMAKQGQITEAERRLLSLAVGLDPSRQRSEEIYKLLLQAKERLGELQTQWMGSLPDADRKAARIEQLKRELENLP